MGITDELREYAQIAFDKGSAGRARVECIADRIDAAHCKALGETAAAAYAEGVESVPIAVDETAWVRLPVDADGVPIRVGDRLDGYNRTIDVQEMRWRGDCRWDMVDEYGDEWHDNYAFVHHHAPTALDTLLELLNEYRDGGGTISEARLSDYAAKLRLAGDDA